MVQQQQQQNLKGNKRENDSINDHHFNTTRKKTRKKELISRMDQIMFDSVWMNEWKKYQKGFVICVAKRKSKKKKKIQR